MLSKRVDSDLSDEVPELDEGWWSAVLADEETLILPVKETQAKTSAQPSTFKVDWDFVRTLYERDEVIQLLVQGYNRGGLLVQGQGVQGFVPVSHLIDAPACPNEDERRQVLAKYVGKTLSLKLIECEQSQERIVLSERAAMAGGGRRKLLFQQLQPGQIVCGVVTNVTDFGVFVDLGGVEGLVHVSEISWGRVQNPLDLVRVGQEVRTLVINISEESSRVALSLKRLNSNPWETLIKRYKPGDVLPASVTSIMRYGAFARLDEGVEGLIHVSSINFPPMVKDIEKYLHPGQRVQVRILHIDAERRRLGLGLVTVE